LALLPIYTSERAVLRQKARPVQRIDRETRRLLDDMLETMRHAPGVGLAGPQVGVSARLIVVEYEEHTFQLVNPELTWFSHETEVADEGCLSIPGYAGPVRRHLKVKVRAKDARGKPLSLTADGWLARIFQHEVDHLDGILFPDRMAPGERLRPVAEAEVPEEAGVGSAAV
jgi:peptide deformylase